MKFHLIAAISKKKSGIGFQGGMPWTLRKDLRYFNKITTNQDNKLSNVVIMGRKTWESLPEKYRPLPNRINVIISSRDLQYPDTIVCRTLTEALGYLETYVYINPEGTFVIGGEMLYAEAIKHPECDKIYLTEIYKDYECDRFFPKIDVDKFSIISVSKFEEEKGLHFRYLVYQNNEHLTQSVWRNEEEYQYLEMLNKILNDGLDRDDRTGVGTLSTFGEQFKYDLRETFPILTTKRIFIRAVFEELMLYLRGQTDNGILNQKGIHIWDANTTRDFLDKRGLSNYSVNDMGETYGFNFRHFGAEYNGYEEDYNGKGFDQLQYVIDLLKDNPTSRRIIINLWNSKTLHKAALPSCLSQYQFYVDTKKKLLNLQIYLRSSDFFLANNWNTCTGAFFVHLLCHVNGIDLTPGYLTVVTGDTHIYKTHINQVRENLKRIPRPAPKLNIKKEVDNIEEFVWEDVELIGYHPYPNIKAEMAV